MTPVEIKKWLAEAYDEWNEHYVPSSYVIRERSDGDIELVVQAVEGDTPRIEAYSLWECELAISAVNDIRTRYPDECTVMLFDVAIQAVRAARSN